MPDHPCVDKPSVGDGGCSELVLLRAENARLRAENARLRAENATLRRKHSAATNNSAALLELCEIARHVMVAEMHHPTRELAEKLQAANRKLRQPVPADDALAAERELEHPQREAAAAALLACVHYLTPRLPLHALEPIWNVIGALADCDAGAHPPLFKPRKVNGRPRVPIKEQCLLALASAAVSLDFEANGKLEDSYRKIAAASGLPIKKLKRFRTHIDDEKRDVIRPMYKSFVSYKENGASDIARDPGADVRIVDLKSTTADAAHFLMDVLKNKTRPV
ncbi:MAG: hypothetical protein WAS73_19065 [Defluviicoccus sp.]